MPWDEFVDLAAGLRPDTALGRIVQIRTETDEEMLKTLYSGNAKDPERLAAESGKGENRKRNTRLYHFHTGSI